MAQIIAISSGKGGVGKSSCCVLLGAALARLGKKVLLLELDSGLRGLDIMTGTENKTVFDLGDVLSGRCEPIKAIVECEFCTDLFLLPASLDFSPVSQGEDFVRLCKGLSNYYDFIFLDLPAGIGDAAQAAAKTADQVLILVTPDPVSMRNGYKASLFFEQHCQASQRLLINRVRLRGGHGTSKKGPVSDLDEVIDTVGVQLLGLIPEDELISASNANGQALPVKAVAYDPLERIAKRLLGAEIPLSFS